MPLLSTTKQPIPQHTMDVLLQELKSDASKWKQCMDMEVFYIPLTREVFEQYEFCQTFLSFLKKYFINMNSENM